jgi:alkanesulfonate monooxygenase SsuD/methylene tetrahydromethanopterin reductase-like flavin-dependent oxidoreductase (luciferase family)
MRPDVFRERSTALDALLTEQGRHPRDLRRTVAALCFFGPTEEVLARRVQPAREWEPELASLSLEAALEAIQTEWGAVAGSPEVVIQQIQAYARAGVEELILQWFHVDDVDGAEAFARHVLPRL